MTKFELSAHEITRLAQEAAKTGTPSGLPTSKPGFYSRAEKENWEYQEVLGQGGRGGIKKLYTLPDYVVQEFTEKGLLYLLEPYGLPEKNEPAEISTERRELLAADSDNVPYVMRPHVKTYDAWAERQDKERIVPVRYHVNVFGSAGNGYELFDDVETEAMWFRASFFDYLGVSPDKCFCTRVKGDSMHPTLLDRGTVLWQMANRYTSEGIYLFRQVNELRIKRLQMVNRHTVQIVSDSSDKDIYPTTLLDLSELQDHEFEIYGRYLWDCGIAH